MNLFYDPRAQAGHFELAEAEARHIVQVLRRSQGDIIRLVDGKGGLWQGPIVSSSKKSCSLDLQLVNQSPRRADHRICLAIAPTKQIDRLEWVLEKATEIGVDCIQPILCRYSERKQIRLDRLQRVLESAMKQSLQAWLPELRPLLPFTEALSGFQQAAKLMAYIDPDVRSTIAHNYQPGQDVCILVGPEGGFHPDEAQLAREQGFQPVWLGPNRLRTETAGLYAIQTIAHLNLPAPS
ncbi:MAG: RsmE family RNA methyltransferase [Bacteroidota bacterium]